MVCQRWRMLFIHDEIATNARHWQTHTLRAALMLCGCVLARVRGEVWTVLRRNRSSFLSGPSPYCERASPLWTKKQWAEWVPCFISVSSPLRGVGKISWTVISHTTIFLLCDQTVFIKGNTLVQVIKSSVAVYPFSVELFWDFTGDWRVLLYLFTIKLKTSESQVQ